MSSSFSIDQSDITVQAIELTPFGSDLVPD